MAPSLFKEEPLDIKQQFHDGANNIQDGSQTIESNMHFLERSNLYNKEKPYSMRYQPDDDLPQSNFSFEKHTITVRSMREGGPYKLNECGFERIDFPSKMTYEDFWDHGKVQTQYLDEVKTALKKSLNAKYIYVLDYAVRKRERSFPVSTGEEYAYDQPASVSHIDFTFRRENGLFECFLVTGPTRFLPDIGSLSTYGNPYEGR